MIQNLNELHASGISRLRYSPSSMNRRLLSVLGLCLALIATAYFLTIVRIHLDNERIRESGIGIGNELSRSVSLPLLGENTQSIQSLLSYAARDKGLKSLSVFDHRDKIVASVRTGENLPSSEDAVLSMGQVSVSESELVDPKNIIGISTDITYAGTKIGEIYMEIPGAETSKFRNQFKIATFSILFLLIVFIIASRYTDISSGVTKIRELYRPKAEIATETAPVMTDAFVTCPLCGTRKAYSSDVFRHSGTEDVFLFKVPGNDQDIGTPADSGGIQLNELGGREDLSWLKRQVILRCSEIIMKLSQ